MRAGDEVTEIISALTEVITDIEGISDKGHMTKQKRFFFHSEVDPEVTIIQEGHTEENIIIEIKMTVDNRTLEFNPYHWLKTYGCITFFQQT